jgi:hypothetical protein
MRMTITQRVLHFCCQQEIKSDKAWQKAVEPKAKTMVKQAHNTFHDDLNKLVKEGGNKTLQYLLAQAVDIEKIQENYNIGIFSELKILILKAFKNGN